VLYPNNLKHWDDPKPENVPYVHVYIRDKHKRRPGN
jgi:hypothetical protein